MNSLTSNQIQTIFDFTEKKYIKYYDVQLELVDHIADKIETLQADDPNLSFDRALHEVYKSFGVFGFTKVQEQKMVELHRYWMRHLKSYIKGYFKLPKIIITVILSLCIYSFMKQGYLYPLLSDLDKASLLLIQFCVSILSVVILTIISKRSLVTTDKKLVCVDTYMGFISIFLIIPCYTFIEPLFMSPPTLPWYVLFSVSTFIAIGIILTHAMLFVFPVMLKAEVERNYKHLIKS